MSGFLERMVAHHASAPTIRPRALSRFEDAGPVRIDAIEALMDPEPGDRRSGRAVVPMEPADDAVRFRRVATPATAGTGPAAGLPVPAAAHDTVDGIERAGSPTSHLQVEQPRAPRSPVPAVARAADASALPARSDGASPPGDPRFAPAPPPVAATSVRVAEPTGRRDVGTRTPDREPDVVEVHIGRIEVRAVVSAPERPGPTLPRHEPVRPLSLERYLSRGSDA